MRKILSLSLLLGTLAVSVPVAQAATSTALTSQEMSRSQPGRWRYGNRNTYTVTRTRIVRVGFRRYRETYRTTYFRNGRTRTRVVSRMIIR